MYFSPELSLEQKQNSRALEFSLFVITAIHLEGYGILNFTIFGLPIQHSCTSYSCLKDSAWITVDLKRYHRYWTDHPPGTLEISLENCPARISPLKSASVLCPSQACYLLQTGKSRLQTVNRHAEGESVTAYCGLCLPLSAWFHKKHLFYKSSNTSIFSCWRQVRW